MEKKTLDPKISILMPNYNYEKYISLAIESVLSQTYENFELIISDNASTDKSVDVIKGFKDKRIKLITNSQNISLYQNIERAKNIASGELLTILHSDDYYESDFLKEIVNAYNQFPDKKVFITGVYNFHEQKNQFNKHYPFNLSDIINKKSVFIDLCSNNVIGNGVNSAFSYDLFKSKPIYSEKYKYAADYELFLRLSLNHDFVYINKILANYRIHSNNLTHAISKNMDMFIEALKIKENILNSSSLKHKNILFIIETFNLINNILYKGINYKSGKSIRNMLLCLKKHRNFVILNPFFYLLFLYSYLLNNKTPVKLYKLTGKLLLALNVKSVKLTKEFLKIV